MREGGNKRITADELGPTVWFDDAMPIASLFLKVYPFINL
jgi:hypothetical protein